LRWRHPQRGLLSPAQFIGIAEDTGLIVPIGTWILTQAIRQASLWRHQTRHRDIGVSINLSARQIAQPDLAITIAKAMEQADLPPPLVTLEVTESVSHTEPNIRMLESLKTLGVRLSIDDFGTGHSSLNYLSRLPVDVLKVDRSFVVGLPRPQDNAIVGAIVTLAHALELDVIAEGVENTEQLDAIAALGVGYVQGFHFARPMSPKAVEELLLTWRPTPLLAGAYAAQSSKQ
jgi:EAL domain-containing protein (putative c-di-GMP-specific phosphodiesterase class I)